MNQIINNPFPYSLDNKRYKTYNYFTHTVYGGKTYKVGIDPGFSCPNRDGTKAFGGCIFCSSEGSGDMILNTSDLEQQISHSMQLMESKWPNANRIAYFQAYSNTHAPLDTLRALYDPFFEDSRFIGLDIATRSDCLDMEKIAYFKEKAKKKDLTIEIGLQSIHEETANWMNRAHDLASVEWALHELKEAGIRTCVHIINGFPHETEAMMLETALMVAKMHPDMIKIHMLHVIRDSRLGAIYRKEPFDLLTQEAYVALVVKQLELLPQDITVARVTGDAMSHELLAPLWTRKKNQVINDIDTLMVTNNTWQGRLYEDKKTA